MILQAQEKKGQTGFAVWHNIGLPQKGPLLASTSPQLTDLLGRYAAQQGHRARGGLSTIAGIDFQLRCYLADFASELARGSHLEEAGAPLLEAFSDYTKSESRQVVCVQVKRTLTEKTLGDAADEAVVLDKFFETEAPNLRESIVYETVGLLGRSDGFAPDWNGVQLPDKKEADWPQRQGYFESMRGAGRFRAPRLVPDPWWRIIAATWQVLDDPFAFAREALEICMRRGMEPEAAAQVRTEVAESFSKRRRAQRFPGHIVTATDVEPATRTSREVLLGQIPTLRHLQDGRFMDRPEQVKTALERLDLHVSARDFHRDPSIYTLWIEGRSGNGKSVLLLQLVQRLVRDRAAQVIWLDDASEHLLPLLEAWAESPVDSTPMTYLFVDDFYAPSKRARIDFPRISRLLREHNRSDWPVLVTCAPPEQRQEWKASGDDEAFRTAHWLLPAVGTDEKNQLRLWFHARTGEEPKTGPAFLQGQGLMISMVFEMREGDLTKFGRRFRARLESLGLVEALTPPLALNRLYILAPGGWLDERQSDALRRLNEDQDFSMMNLGGRSGEFVRVTHPHLSNAIYEAVRERDDAIVRARDLHRAFAKSMQSGDYTTARLILYRVAANHERLASLDAAELARGMTGAWLSSIAETPFAGPELANLWTNWAVWSARQPLVSELLREPPLERAREALKQNHVYWAALWNSLWQSAPGHVGLVSDAEAWLKSDEGLQSRHWSFVWEILFARTSKAQDSSSLAAAAADWLRENEFEPDWNFVFRPLATRFPERAPWDSALRLLDAFPGNRNWPYVFEAAADTAAAVGSDRWHRVLLRGWEWLGTEETQEAPEWGFVWQKLAELRAELPEKTAQGLLPLGYEWLAGHEDRDDWSFIWQKLVEVRAELPEKTVQGLLPLGYEWLAGREERDGWSFIWQKLVEVRAALPEGTGQRLLPLGNEWLAGREDRDDWSCILQKLVELRAELPEKIARALNDRALRWLVRPRNADRGEWDKLWEACFRDSYRDASFLAAGANWVLNHRTLPQNYGLAIELLSAAGGNWVPPLELVGFCRNWLSENTRHPSWTFLFGPLWVVDPSQETASLVPPWLDANPRAGALWVVKRLLRARNAEINSMLQKWVDAHPDSPQSVAIREVVDRHRKAGV